MGQFQSGNYEVFFSGHDKLGGNGVTLILRLWQLGPQCRSDRMTSIRLPGKPVSITIIQVCAPTAEAEEDGIDSTQTSKKRLIAHQ